MIRSTVIKVTARRKLHQSSKAGLRHHKHSVQILQPLIVKVGVSHQRRPTVSQPDSSTDSATMYRHVCPSCNDYHRLFACQNFKYMKPLDCLNFVKSIPVKSIPAEPSGKQLENIDLDKEELPQDRALGVKWNTNTDSFYFKPKCDHILEGV